MEIFIKIIIVNIFILTSLEIRCQCVELSALNVKQLKALAHCEAKCYQNKVQNEHRISSTTTNHQPEQYPCISDICNECRNESQLRLDNLQTCIEACKNDEECTEICECFHKSMHELPISKTSVSILPPTLACRDLLTDSSSSHVRDSSVLVIRLGLTGRTDQPIVYVVEIRHRTNESKTSEDWTPAAKTIFQLLEVSYLRSNMQYQFRVTAVAPDGILGNTQGTILSEWIPTLAVDSKLSAPKNVYVESTFAEGRHLSARVTWTPPDEIFCYYKLFYHHDGDGVIRGEDIFLPSDGREIKLSKLDFATNYTLQLETTSKDGIQHSQKVTNWTMTSSCTDVFGQNFTLCGPGPPRNIVSNLWDKVGTDRPSVNLSWHTPDFVADHNVVLKYLARLEKQLSFAASGPISLPYSQNKTVLGNVSQVVFAGVPRGHTYLLTVTAVSIGGQGLPGKTSITIPAETHSLTSTILLYVGLSVLFCLILITVGGLCYKSYKRRQAKAIRDSYFKTLEKSEHGINYEKEADPILPKRNDVYEMDFSALLIGDILGQGAFGIVRKAQMRSNKPWECWENVAVKMLRPGYDEYDERQLLDEIEMIKSIGSHPNIVSLLAYCPKPPNICLVVEYCHFGDLQSYLRRMRYDKIQEMFNKVNLLQRQDERFMDSGLENQSETDSHFNDKADFINYSSVQPGSTRSSETNSARTSGYSSLELHNSSSRSDGSVAYDSRNSSKTFTKKYGYENGTSQRTRNYSHCDIDGQQDKNLNFAAVSPIAPVDLLSYARQIAMGMEYLSQNKFVHRDLAARNVLVYSPKIVKIADFGLMRDIYENSLYRRKTEGKLPIKWMAYESIFDHIFTSKSDVWSYGILLWEIATLGGTPYPGVSSAQLIKLLQNNPGYKMQRPSNCSNEIYEIMTKCWQISPVQRPTFTELRHKFESMLETTLEYISLDFNEFSEDYYENSIESSSTEV